MTSHIFLALGMWGDVVSAYALFRNGVGERGLWVIDSKGAYIRRLCEGNCMPIRWSEDGKRLYAANRGQGQIQEIQVSSGQVLSVQDFMDASDMTIGRL